MFKIFVKLKILGFFISLSDSFLRTYMTTAADYWPVADRHQRLPVWGSVISTFILCQFSSFFQWYLHTDNILSI